MCSNYLLSLCLSLIFPPPAVVVVVEAEERLSVNVRSSWAVFPSAFRLPAVLVLIAAGKRRGDTTSTVSTQPTYPPPPTHPLHRPFQPTPAYPQPPPPRPFSFHLLYLFLPSISPLIVFPSAQRVCMSWGLVFHDCHLGFFSRSAPAEK